MFAIEIGWWISLLVLTGYHLFVFLRKEKPTPAAEEKDLPGVSIVVAVKNGSRSLLRHINSFSTQQYPWYEIIIVDDHSDEKQRDQLAEGVAGNEKIRLILSDKQPGKKHALTLGIKEATHPLILCTDADSYPKGNEWIREMVLAAKRYNMVLGYSPYEKRNGWLNRLIRFETFMTGMQYLSWAMRGKPYMGVGRNLMYEKKLFQEIDPYVGDKLPYGDDDLWVQQAAKRAKVNVCFNNKAHVISEPATTFSQWLQQKHRHLSAGHQYEVRAWWRPAGFGIALMASWFLLIPLLIKGCSLWVMCGCIAGLLLRWYTHLQWTKRLGDRDTNYWFPALELLYAVYLAGMGCITMLVKKKSWN